MHRYCRIEYERRFLVRGLPPGDAWAVRRMVDRYLDGTRIRLRYSDGVVDGRPETIRKLTQKVPFDNCVPGKHGELTSMYLNADEYEALRKLPAAEIGKVRYSHPPLGIDVFEGALSGLFIAEMEFETEPEMAAFEPPWYCVQEISGDRRYQGGTLARLTCREAAALLETTHGLLRA